MNRTAEPAAAEPANDPNGSATSALASRRASAGLLLSLGERYAAVVVLVAFIVGFSIALPGIFFQIGNFQTIAGEEAVAGLVALALLPTLAAGDFDLSVGANLTLAATITVGLQASGGFAWPVAAGVAICAAMAVGAINSILVVRIGMNSLITTLGVQSVLTGVILYYTGGSILYTNFPQTFLNFGRWTFGGWPGSVVYLAVAAVAMWLLLRRTRTGRFMFAIGSNSEAARLSGVNNRRVRTIGFLVTGALVGFAGVLLAANSGSGDPNAGANYLLPAFAATFLGATTITPGRFNVAGTIVAVYLLGVGVTGLQEAGAPFYASPIFNGAALVIAVGGATVLARRRSRGG